MNNTKKTPSVKTPKFAAGRKVLVTRAGRELGTGRYVAATVAKNGAWHTVNMAEARKPAKYLKVRTANLTRV